MLQRHGHVGRGTAPAVQAEQPALSSGNLFHQPHSSVKGDRFPTLYLLEGELCPSEDNSEQLGADSSIPLTVWLCTTAASLKPHFPLF